MSTTDPNGNVTTSTWDAARRLLATTSPPTSAAPAGLTTANSYDVDGRLLEARQSAGGGVLRTTRSTWTPTGKPATATDANGNTTRYAYDRLDRQAAVTDAAGRVTRFSYDGAGRPRQTVNPAIQAGPLLEQTWTDDGLPATLADANGNVTAFAYDGFDRLATTTYPLGSSESLTYDADGNVLTRTTRAGDTIAFAYDTLNRLVTKAVTGGTTVSYGYDLAGRLTSVSDDGAALPAVAMPVSTVAYTTSTAYDALNRPTGVVFSDVPAATPPAAGALVAFGHSYNAVNQRIGQTVSDSTWLAYPAATPSTTSYTANALNQYTAAGAVTPTWDANGNLTFDGTGTYGYDAENRLTSASGGGHTASYRYDAQGRRSARTVDGTTTISVTDADDRQVLEYDGTTGQILHWHAYGLGPNAVLGQMDVVAGTRTMPIPDLLGSVIASVDAGSGTISKSGYLPYGSGTPATPFGFTGQRLDPETGLYSYRARHYSTAFGRFLQTDPIGYVAGANLYAYVGNDPLNFTDPEGLAWTAIADAFRSLTQSAFATTADSLLQTMVNPYVGFYQRSIVGTINTAANFAPALFDPGFYASIQGAGPPGALVGSLGNLATSAIGGVLKLGRSAGDLAVRAESALSGQLLRNQLAGQEIAGGHAFAKHAGELGFTNPAQMASHVENVMTNPSAVRTLSGGRTAYWDNATQSVVIRNPSAADGGTVFRPTNGISYFNNLR